MDLLDAENLNRVGIVSNVAAGFLIAPELIGKDRIRACESWVERGAAKLQNFGSYGASKQVDHITLHSGIVIALSGVTLPLLCWYFAWTDADVRLRAFFACTVILAVGLYLHLIRPNEVAQTWDIVATIALGAATSFIVWLSSGFPGLITLIVTTFVLVSLYALFWTIPDSLRPPWPQQLALCGFMAAFAWPLFGIGSASLTVFVAGLQLGRGLLWVMDPERERLQGALVAAGVLLFLGGNALQLWATY